MIFRVYDLSIIISLTTLDPNIDFKYRQMIKNYVEKKAILKSLKINFKALDKFKSFPPTIKIVTKTLLRYELY